MGRIASLVDRVAARLDRPADQSVLTNTDRDGSERIIDSSTPSEAAATVRRNRNRIRRRWLGC
jgi:predicted NAD-dependent protein-ADP-ribosyltransferase YbiA (DUF1768 family)